MRFDVSGKSGKFICLTVADKAVLLQTCELLNDVLESAKWGNVTAADRAEVASAEKALQELHTFLDFMEIRY